MTINQFDLFTSAAHFSIVVVVVAACGFSVVAC